jgi:hypothetical protein
MGCVPLGELVGKLNITSTGLSGIHPGIQILQAYAIINIGDQ